MDIFCTSINPNGETETRIVAKSVLILEIGKNKGFDLPFKEITLRITPALAETLENSPKNGKLQYCLVRREKSFLEKMEEYFPPPPN